jgi:acyl-CoA thioesterase-2
MQGRATQVVDLYDLVTVQPADDAHPGTFVGHPVPGPWGRIFGGQLLGQAVSAAAATVGAYPFRLAHSMHAYFVSAGDVGHPVTYDVETVRDGRTFSARMVRAHQNGRLLLNVNMSFQEVRPGLSHQASWAGSYPDPESLPMIDPTPETEAESVELAGHRSFVELRRIPQALDPAAPGRRGGQAVWIRARQPRGGQGDVIDRAALAMSSDFTALESAMGAHDLTFATPRLTVASLDHAIWWHAPASLDDWVLYVQQSPWAGGERALISGQLYDRRGRLLASVAQEGLVRLASKANEAAQS